MTRIRNVFIALALAGAGLAGLYLAFGERSAGESGGTVVERVGRHGSPAPLSAGDPAEATEAAAASALASAILGRPESRERAPAGEASEDDDGTARSDLSTLVDVRLSVHAKGERSRALPSFELELAISRIVATNTWRTVEVLQGVETGPDGAWHGQVTRPHKLPEGQHLTVRVREPGYQGRCMPLRLSDRDDPDSAWVATLAARPGASVAGRVVDVNGVGVKAHVQFSRASEVAKYPSFTASHSSRSDEAGWFTLFIQEKDGFDRGGRVEGTLTATTDVGTGALAGEVWTLGSPPQDLLIVVSGDGAVVGTVRDPAGVPVPGLPLRVALAESLAEGRDPRFVGQRATDREVGNGLASVDVLTDADGHFEAGGLRPEPYQVFIKGGRYEFLRKAVELTDGAVPADGEELALVFGRPTLRLVLLAEDGTPWTGPVQFASKDSHQHWLPESWPDVPTVLLTPVSMVGGQARFAADPRPALSGRRMLDGSIAFEVADAESFDVRVMGGTRAGGMFDGAPTHFTRGPGVYRWDHVVQAEDVEPSLGRARIQVMTLSSQDGGRMFEVLLAKSQGKAPPPKPEAVLEPFSASTGMRLAIEAAETGAPVAEASQWPSGEAWEPMLPQGKYRLRPWRDPYASSIPWSDELPIPALGDDWVFEVKAGETVDVFVETAVGARVELTFGSDGPGDENRCAYPVLEDVHGRLWPLVRRERRRNEIGTCLTPCWHPGGAAESERMPAGQYQLRCTMPSGDRIIERAVELVEGETLKLNLR